MRPSRLHESLKSGIQQRLQDFRMQSA